MRVIVAGALIALLTACGTGAESQPDSAPIQPAAQCSAPDPGPWVVDPATVGASAGPGRPADAAAEQRVRSAVSGFLACLDSGTGRVATLFTPNFIESFMHQHDYASVARVLGGLRMTDVRIRDITGFSDGSYSIEATFIAYGHKQARERWYWWPDSDGQLKVNRLEPLETAVAPTTTTVDVEVGDYYYRLPDSVVRAPNGAVALRLRQTGSTRHEAILLRLPEGADAKSLLSGQVPRDAAVTIAQDNGSDVMSLIALQPGTYTLLSFEPGPDGKPLALHGLTTQFNIERD